MGAGGGTAGLAFTAISAADAAPMVAIESSEAVANAHPKCLFMT
jgi:hypothetical protein